MLHSLSPGFELSPVVIAGVVVVTASFFMLVLSMLFRSRKRLVITGTRIFASASSMSMKSRLASGHTKEGRGGNVGLRRIDKGAGQMGGFD
jgi:hypothetical protein